MKIERTKNATRNIIFGSALKLYQIVIPFVMRTIILYVLGEKYLGLNSLFASILQVLNLTELGVGGAMVYSMYKPIAEDDYDTICALMKMYRFYYRIIGLVVAVLGVAIIPLLPYLVKVDSVPSDVNIYILYFLNLGSTVLSYWLFAYKNCLLGAHQREDVVSKIALCVNSGQYALQAVTLLIWKNYYAYLIIALFAQIVNNLFTAYMSSRYYPQYKPSGKLDKGIRDDINHRIRDLFTSKVGLVINDSVDTIVISAFLGLSVLAIYQNYFYILSSVVGFISVFFSSCTAGIGNSIVVESAEKNLQDLKKLTFLISWISGFCASCLLCLYQPFMKIWAGENLMLPFSIVILLCAYFYLREINQLLNLYKDAAGMWHEDRFRPLITSLSNLGMNLIMVQFLGLYGIVLSTFLSVLLVGMPWLLNNLFTVLFEKNKMMIYIKDLLKYTMVAAIACVCCYAVCSIWKLSDWGMLIVRGVICCIVPNLIFLLIFRKKPEFRQTMELLNRMTKGRFHLDKLVERIG